MVDVAKPLVRATEPNAQQLYGWLFGEANIGAQLNVENTLSGIRQNCDAVDSPKGGRGKDADVQVYCTLNRLRKSPKKDRWFDPSTNLFLQKLGEKASCFIPLAYTITPKEEDEDQPDTLQMCPWFLDWAMLQPFKFRPQVTENQMRNGKKSWRIWFASNVIYKAMIDVFGLFDKVIVHELSHTRRAGETDDVNGFFGYGWKNARKLSTSREENKQSYRSADSIAMFASAGDLMDRGAVISEDGSFTVPADWRPSGGNGQGGDGQGEGNNKRADPFALKARPVFVS